MQSIEEWLAELGLGKYAAAFSEAEVDFATLAELGESDLAELGLPLGPRRKISRAIERLSFKASDTANPPEPIQPVTGLRHGLDREGQAERRHLTIMFVDLVGSTQIASRLDAEDTRQVIADYQTTVARVVQNYKGFVATLMGDGVLCYFGWPHANEHDTERAVRAGLAVIKTVSKLSTPDGVALATRVAVATGVVVVGDLVGPQARQKALVVGETPNLAARLQNVAHANQLVIPADTIPLLGNAFRLEAIGAQDLKGIDRPVKAYVVHAEAQLETRFAARVTGALSPLVGREKELTTLRDTWRKVTAGQGRMVLLMGEAGIGKSRIVRGFKDWLASQNQNWYTIQCSPYHTDTAFFPFAQFLEFNAGFDPSDSDATRLIKLRTTFGLNDQQLALVGNIFDLDTPLPEALANLQPQQIRKMTMQVFVDLLAAQASKAPAMLVVEDLHWIDPTSLELLHRIAEIGKLYPVMVLATKRQNLPPDPSELPAHDLVALSRLNRNMSTEIIAAQTGGRALPPEITRIIARQTDGVPLFVEELTKTILESDALKLDGDRYVLQGSLSDISIPKTLHDSLAARLDRLGPIKEIAQIAACIGRDFSYRLMDPVCAIPSRRLQEALDVLISVGLLWRRGLGEEARYSFKHALVRDAAYDSLLKDQRRQIHHQIFEAMESERETSLELLATHAEAAGLTDRAMALWEEAGQAALARPAYLESEAHLRRAIKLNAPLLAQGDSAAMTRAVSHYTKLSVALAPAKGFWSDEVISTLETAQSYARQVNDMHRQGDIAYELLLGTYFRGKLAQSLQRADDLEQIALGSGDTLHLMVARRIAGVVQMNMGEFVHAQTALDAAEDVAQTLQDANLTERFGHDPIVALYVYQSLNAAFRGQTERMLAYRHKAEDRASRLGHINTTCTMLGILVISAHVYGDVDVERDMSKRVTELSHAHDVSASVLGANAVTALADLAQGDHGALERYNTAEAQILQVSLKLLVPGHRVLAAARAAEAGLFAQADEMLNRAAKLMQETGEKSWFAEWLRVRAVLDRQSGKDDAARQNLERAIKLAQDTGATLWHMRAAADLAVLMRDQRDMARARQVVTTALARLGEKDAPQERDNLTKLLAQLAT